MMMMKIANVKNKVKAFLICLLIPFAGFAQSFTIKGYGKGLKNGDRIYMLYREPGATSSVADSTTVVNGAFEFKGNVVNITTGGIYRNTNPVYANTIKDQFTIYIEPGEIVMKSLDTLRNTVVSGTALNNDYMRLVTALMPISAQMNQLKEVEELSETDQKNQVLVANLNKQWEDLGALTRIAQFDFIKKNTDSYVSLVTLNSLSINAKLLAKVEDYYLLLSARLKEMPMAKNILRRIEFAKKINVGMMAKDFSQQDSNGKMIQLSAYKGKYVLVDFWASWCLPCREENPNVIVAYQKYQKMGFEVLGVSIDDKEGKAAWLKAIKDDGLTWTQVSDLKGWKNEVAILYGITSVPSNVLIDPNGRIIAKNLKGKALTDQLAFLFDRK